MAKSSKKSETLLWKKFRIICPTTKTKSCFWVLNVNEWMIKF